MLADLESFSTGRWLASRSKFNASFLIDWQVSPECLQPRRKFLANSCSAGFHCSSSNTQRSSYRVTLKKIRYYGICCWKRSDNADSVAKSNGTRKRATHRGNNGSGVYFAGSLRASTLHSAPPFCKLTAGNEKEEQLSRFAVFQPSASPLARSKRARPSLIPSH